MYAPIKHLKVQWALASRALVRMQTGGDWALRLPDPVRQNLKWFFYDGFFSAASDNIIGTYLVVYLLALGASQAQIGLMSSISSLTAALMLMPGALLVERLGKRKEITVFGGGIGARLMICLLALTPFLFHGPALVVAAIAMSITRDMLGNLSFPAWMSLTADIVPIEGRGRYFSSRNFAMAIAGMVMTLLAGLLLSRTLQPTGYQVALMVAFAIGLASTYSFARLKDPHPQTSRPVAPAVAFHKALPQALREVRQHPTFLTYMGITALWNFSLNIAGPFFNVYMVQNLQASAAMIGITSIASTLANMLVQRKVGDLNDRWGARKLQMLSGLSIPLVPMLWIFVQSPWHIIPLNLLSGALWGAYNLAAFNYLLAITPEARRARYSALFQITVMLSLAVGAAFGSLVVTRWGYPAIFIGSGLGRLAAAGLFARFSRGESPLQQEALPAQG